MSLSKLRIRQIFYEKSQQYWLDPRFEPYYNHKSNYLLENQAIIDLWKNDDHLFSEYYGVFSHKFKRKLNMSGDLIEVLMQKDDYAHDVYTFFKKNRKCNLILQANNWHEHFIEIYERIVKVMQWDDIVDRNIHFEPIFSNHWIAKSAIFDDYVSNFLRDVILVMNRDKVLKEMCFRDAKYLSKNKVNSDVCLKVFGVPYYTYHAFILERLFPIYCYFNNIKVKHFD